MPIRAHPFRSSNNSAAMRRHRAGIIDNRASLCRNAATYSERGTSMTDRSWSALTLGLLASTALATPAFAQTPPPVDATPSTSTTQSPAPGTNATDVTAPPPKAQKAQEGEVQDQTEIVITATKREEFLQNVPMSVQALGTRRLDQLDVSNFQDYSKQLPSVNRSEERRVGKESRTRR